VEWGDNAAIGDKVPAEYLPEYTKRFTQEDLASLWHWHALPLGWESMPYQDFLAERHQLIAGVIREAFGRLRD